MVARAAQNISFFADWARHLRPEPIVGEAHNSVHFDPAGVAALIVPWNAPLMLGTWKVGPALAAGNTVVVEPPEWAPFSLSLLGQLALDVGIPPGVLNVVHGAGESAGAALVAHPDHFARVQGFVERALAAGARPVVGGGPHPFGPLYYAPTILADVEQTSEIVQEEVFGPVLTLQTFSSDAEAIELANGTRFGLAGTLFSTDEAHAARITDALVAGTLWVNCFFVRDLAAPFGGARQSGVGREGGTWSFDFFCDVKNVAVRPGSFAH